MSPQWLLKTGWSLKSGGAAVCWGSRQCLELTIALMALSALWSQGATPCPYTPDKLHQILHIFPAKIRGWVDSARTGACDSECGCAVVFPHPSWVAGVGTGWQGWHLREGLTHLNARRGVIPTSWPLPGTAQTNIHISISPFKPPSGH